VYHKNEVATMGHHCKHTKGGLCKCKCNTLFKGAYNPRTLDLYSHTIALPVDAPTFQPTSHPTSAPTKLICHPSCGTCSGPAANQCTACKTAANTPGFGYTESFNFNGDRRQGDGAYLDNGSCLPCDNSCEQCSGPSSSQCTSCYYGNRYPSMILASGSCNKRECGPGSWSCNSDSCGGSGCAAGSAPGSCPSNNWGVSQCGCNNYGNGWLSQGGSCQAAVNGYWNGWGYFYVENSNTPGEV